VTGSLTPRDLRSIIDAGGEFSLLDVRDPSSFQAGHLLLSVNTPVESLAESIVRLVPRRQTQIILCGTEEQTRNASAILTGLDYSDVGFLDAVPEDWIAAGFQVFSGTYTINNALAVAAERYYGTPRMTAEVLHARRGSGENIIVIDSRPFDEFHAETIPGAVNVPIAELIHIVPGLVDDATTEIVVTCGGRARAVIGAQSLIHMEMQNRVSALYYGTTGWNLAGLDRQGGSQTTCPSITDATRTHAVEHVNRLTRHFGIRRIDRAKLTGWQAESEEFTLYMIDVRTREEFDRGHIPGSRWVPGGELVGLTEDHIACRNARLCLIDDDGARATLTASWMIQMGWHDTVVLEGGTTTWPDDELIGRAEGLNPRPVIRPETALPPTPRAFADIRELIENRERLPEQVARDGSLSFQFPSSTKRTRN